MYFLYAEYNMRNTGLDEAQAGIKIAGRNINNLRCTDDTTLMAESKEKIKSDTVSTVSPSISHEVMGLDAMISVF